MGQLFWLSPKLRDFRGFRHGYRFWPKSPLKMGMGFEARAAHPCPTQIWVPPWAPNIIPHKLCIFKFVSQPSNNIASKFQVQCLYPLVYTCCLIYSTIANKHKHALPTNHVVIFYIMQPNYIGNLQSRCTMFPTDVPQT